MKVNMNELVPLIKEVIARGTSFRMYPNGRSMLPTIVAGKDSVDLSLPVGLKKYDIVLYSRDNGQYVLHRIVKVHGEYFDMCGDAQHCIEKNVHSDNVIALVSAVYKGDKCIKRNSKSFILYAYFLYKQKAIKRMGLKLKSVYKRILKR